MKLLKLSFFLSLSLFMLASCQKDVDDNNNNNNNAPTVDANGNLRVSSDADGACYAIKNRVYYDNNSSDYDEYQTAFSWFGSQTAFKPAGNVSLNTYDLMFLSGVNYYAYVGFDTLVSANTAVWTVQGDAAAGVPGFTHTDNTAFNTGGSFVLPSSVNINNPLTVSFAPISNVVGVVYTVQGNIGQKSKAVANGASSVTFSSAELREVAYPQDAIAVHIMSVTYTEQNINGKKIYFVKQFQHSRETSTL